MSGRMDLGRVVGIDGQGVPTGGGAGQYLRKRSASDYDAEWVDQPSRVPTGGGAGQYLRKRSATSFDAEWADPTPYIDGQNLGNNNAGFHNSMYRGKSLGSALTSAQSTAIRAGTFDDLFIGDYWTINGIVWRIAGFDMYYKCGDTSLDTHHLCVVPDTALENSVWNDTDNTVTGGPEGGAGYIGSKIRAAVKASGGSESMVIAAFGDSHVLSYRALYPSAYSSEGEATGWAWTNARVELMNETMVYGHQACANNGRYNGYENGIDDRQLPLFMMNPTLGRIQVSWWLRSVFFAAHVCRVNSDGSADYAGAHYSNGVRPFALIA